MSTTRYTSQAELGHRTDLMTRQDDRAGNEGKYSTLGLPEAEYEPGSRGRVLANKLGIVRVRDIRQAESEALLSLTESLVLELTDSQRFSVDDLRSFHRRWLQDIYPWAGEYRQVNMGKGGFQCAAAHWIPHLMAEYDRSRRAGWRLRADGGCVPQRAQSVFTGRAVLTREGPTVFFVTLAALLVATPLTLNGAEIPSIADDVTTVSRTASLRWPAVLRCLLVAAREGIAVILSDSGGQIRAERWPGACSLGGVRGPFSCGDRLTSVCGGTRSDPRLSGMDLRPRSGYGAAPPKRGARPRSWPARAHG